MSMFSRNKAVVRQAANRIQHSMVLNRQRKLNVRQRKQVKRIVGHQLELKYFSNNFTPTAITSTGFLNGIPFDISQGSTDTERIGDSLMWCGNLELRIQVVNGEGASSDVYNNLRFVILQWHPTTTGTPYPATTGSDIFLVGPSGNVDVYSQYKHDTRQNYRILFDKVFTTVGNGTSTTAPYADNVTSGVRHYSLPLKKLRKQVQYVAGGNQGTNRLFCFYVSDSVFATHPVLTFSTKVFFRDG